MADTHAHVAVPDKVLWALLNVASAGAFLIVPVVSVIDTGLGSADPVADFGSGVPGVDDSSLLIGVRSTESAKAFLCFLAEVPEFWARNNCSQDAVLHIKVLVIGNNLRVEATAAATVGIPEFIITTNDVCNLARASL